MATKRVAHATTGGGLRYDIDAILDDPRNWKGATAQKEQALLRQIVRQSNDAPEPFHALPPSRPGWRVVSLGKVEAYTGIQRATAVRLLQDLDRRGFLALETENPGTRQAVYRVKLNRRADCWPVKVVHLANDLGARGCAF